MKTVIDIIEINIVFAALYLIYKLFLEKETFFQLNRFYLLSAVVASIVIGCIKLPVSTSLPALQEAFTIEMPPILIDSSNLMISSDHSYFSLITLIYSLVCFIFILTFIRNVYLGLKQIGVKTLGRQASSFLNRYHVGTGWNEQEINAITEHEMIHVRQLHTIDILFFELIKCFFWFNPFIWMASKSIRLVHEYIADEGALKSSNREQYSMLLLQETLGVTEIPLTHSFSNSLIKSRITMIYTSSSSKTNYWKYTIALPVLAIAFLLQTNASAQQIDSEKNSIDPTTSQTNPEYPGGHEAMVAFMKKNMVYPASEKVETKCYIGFVVLTDGSIGKVEVKRSGGEAFDKEAMRVIKLMPKWTPGTKHGKAVESEMTIPVHFIKPETKKE